MLLWMYDRTIDLVDWALEIGNVSFFITAILLWYGALLLLGLVNAIRVPKLGTD